MLAFVVSAKIGEPPGRESAVIFEAMKSSVAFEMRLLVINASMNFLIATREAAYPTLVPLQTTYLETGYTRTFYGVIGSRILGSCSAVNDEHLFSMNVWLPKIFSDVVWIFIPKTGSRTRAEACRRWRRSPYSSSALRLTICHGVSG